MSDHVLTSYFGDIFFEFKVHDDARDTIIYLPGFPSSGSKGDKINTFYDLGYNVFAPKYRGTYQSHGTFLEENPVEDFTAYLKQLQDGKATNLWDESTVEYEINNLVLIGSSFSGGITLSLTMKAVVDKAILLAPVIDYEAFDGQDLEHLTQFVRRAFQHVIRLDFNDLTEKITGYDDCNPSAYKHAIDTPTLVLHGDQDQTVPIEHSKSFSDEQNMVQHVRVQGVDHSSTDLLAEQQATWQKFIRQ